ncbi:hypothetical protein PtA15_16A256 [Puccinia triticina]|uniref:Pyroglutamyl-peptidase I n=1 Tax=Puccinia triticina TaxID=208348 RepID=A0ABY7D534_9BASI|nr:uncharacterized protein PtA15_16A256 [Puccinia triticina]WAQ92350.1 hypothetical protein PtA15_16A256 [Puccinia triticina]WAR64082.1 hypothetical protein PtB15_16B242 [Puccinia triticina]
MPCVPTQRPLKVLLTGFGPFRTHETNASFEIVQRVVAESTRLEGVELVGHPEPVRVSYTAVDALLTQLYQTHPGLDLVIHTGIAGSLPRAHFLLEKIAHREHYLHPDVDGFVLDSFANLPTHNHSSPGPLSLSSSVDLLPLLQNVTDQISEPIDLKVSENAGRYLCEFIYYYSLQRFEKSTPRSSNVEEETEEREEDPVQLRRPVLFVHLPPLLNPFDIRLGALVLQTIILQIRALHFPSR